MRQLVLLYIFLSLQNVDPFSLSLFVRSWRTVTNSLPDDNLSLFSRPQIIAGSLTMLGP